jgi:hypothetical protein
MVFDPPRRRRRAWRWMVPALLVAVALIALSASGAGSDTREDLEYLNQMSAQIEQIALGGDSLRGVATRLSSIDRPELVVVVDELRADIATALEFAEQEPPSVELFAVRSLYRLALRAWNSGVGDFGNGLLAAADNPEETDPVGAISNSIVSLRAGDRLFSDLLDEVDRLDVPDPIPPFRNVALSPDDGQAVTLAVSYSLAARSSTNNLALRPGLGVSQLVAAPEWQLSPDDIVVMPATEEAIFSAVVSNTGNLVSVEEQLNFTFAGAGDPIELTVVVPPLAAGAQTTIEFEPISVVPGETYEVRVEIVVSDVDASFEDNLIEVTFRVNNNE